MQTLLRGGGNQQSASIFDKLDTDDNGVLSEKEIEAFKQQIAKAAGDDGKLSGKEAQNFLNGLGIKGNSQSVYGFLNATSAASKNIVSSEENNNSTVTRYNNGNTMTTNQDGETVATDSGGNKIWEERPECDNQGEVYTNRTEYAADGQTKTRETKTTDKGSLTIDYEADGTTPKQYSGVVNNEDGSKTQEIYSRFDADNNPLITQKTENFGTKNAIVTDYTYDEAGNLTREVSTQGKGTISESRTAVNYNPDGTVAKTTQISGDSNPVVTDYSYSNEVQGGFDTQVTTAVTNRGQENEVTTTERQTEVNRTVETKDAKGNITTDGYDITTNENGETSEVWTGTKLQGTDGRTVSTYPTQDGNIESGISLPDGTGVQTRTTQDGQPLWQTYTDSKGNETTALYTKDGNTVDTVQLHENMSSICGRYGVTQEQLLAANPELKAEDFKPGQKIVIPGIYQASDMAGRKDTAGVVKQSRHEARNATKEKMEQDLYLDPSTYTPNGRKVTLDVPSGTKEVKQGWGSGSVTTGTVLTYEKSEFQVVGKAKDGNHYIVKDDEGYYYANKDLTEISMTTKEEMGGAVFYKNGQHQKVKIDHDAYGISEKEIAYTGKTDEYGNKYGVDGSGRQVVIDKKTNTAYYADSMKANRLHNKNILENDTQAAAKAMTTRLSKEIAAAEEEFNNFLDHETAEQWTADVASHCWGSKNNEANVKKDIAESKRLMKTLNDVSDNEEMFNMQFKDTFGIPYDPRAVADYVTATTEEERNELREKAFGTSPNADMMGRVDRYVSSSKQGGRVVRGLVVGTVSAVPGVGGLALGVGTAATFEANDWTNGQGHYTKENGDYGTSIGVDGWDKWKEDQLTAKNAGKFALYSAWEGAAAKAVSTGMKKAAGAAVKGIARDIPALNGAAAKVSGAASRTTAGKVGYQAGKFAVKEGRELVVDTARDETFEYVTTGQVSTTIEDKAKGKAQDYAIASGKKVIKTTGKYTAKGISAVAKGIGTASKKLFSRFS